MPSAAYLNFLRIREDVRRLIETHSLYTENRRGRKNLGYLTRSAVVMLCAAWERYNEDLLLESITYVSSQIADVSHLNGAIKKTISAKVKKDSHELKPLDLAGFGWRSVWYGYAESAVRGLNTPKSGQLKELFETYLGIDYLALWEAGAEHQINQFVSDRGEIAHNGNRAMYIRMTLLRKYQDMVTENVIEIDSNIAGTLQAMVALPDLPWVRVYYTDLDRY